ncbi:transcriptional regulator [Roseomonas sp. BN140053]|uniref:transcriptional regulator n=1 Tax=Roseomonas sp. BN140053 TaxID=3391898 RepID=UPI0039ECEEFB
MNTLTPGQCRAARELLRWTRLQLGVQSGIADYTVRGFELARQELRPRTTRAIRNALEAAGIEFIPEIGGGAGVRLLRR